MIGPRLRLRVKREADPRGLRKSEPLVSKRGFTLLELMLALALTAVVLALMNMAIDLHLRTFDSRRRNLEESQLARALLRIIADDVRAAVQSYEQDVSGVQAMIQQAASTATQQLTGSAGQSSGQSTTGQTSSGQTSGSGAPTGSQTASSTTASSQSSGSTTGASSSAGSTGDTSGDTSTDLSAVTVPELPGIYGNQYQLQVDVSRLPRIEQYQRMLAAESVTKVTDIPSDVKTVTYYVKTPAATETGVTGSAMGGTGYMSSLTDPNAHATGLVRRELDRAVTSAAIANGNVTGLENSGELIAPEVVSIEFRYFDGTEWRLEWDTSAEQMLPLAIQILVAMTTTTEAGRSSATSTSGAEFPANMRIYTMIVNLPTGGQASSAKSSSSSTTSSASSTTTGTGTTP